MDRDEYLAICKKNAMEYFNDGDLANAVTSMLSDLSKHPELKGIGEKMAPVGMMFLINYDERGIKGFIEGFR
jgi:hypothetical protein